MTNRTRHKGEHFFNGGLLSPSGMQNILNAKTKYTFDFTGYPNNGNGGSDPRNVADEINRGSSVDWTNYGYQTMQDGGGAAYLKVDCKDAYRVTHTAVSGYNNGSHKPTGTWYLEGSNDDSNWDVVATCHPDQWTPNTTGTNVQDQTYPFKPHQIIECQNPGMYRYYRIIATGWTNSYMLVMNWGLFVGGGMVDHFNAPMMGQIMLHQTSTSTNAIISNDAGYAEFGTKNYNGQSDWFSFGGGTGGANSGITIQRPGILFLTYNQDIITTGSTGYVTTRTLVNGSINTYQLITRTDGQWDSIHNSMSCYVNKGDTVDVWFGGADITGMDHSTWGQYNFLWFNSAF